MGKVGVGTENIIRLVRFARLRAARHPRVFRARFAPFFFHVLSSTLLSLLFIAVVQFSRESIRSFNDQIKIRENRGAAHFSGKRAKRASLW